MAITNAMIIADYMTMNNITSPLHTYVKWKAMGYQVKRGEKSHHKITIWKAVSKKAKADDGTEVISSRMIMTDAYFFTLEQVERMQK